MLSASQVFAGIWKKDKAEGQLIDAPAPSVFMNASRTPSVVVHCDWSKSPSKRWMAIAISVNGMWAVTGIEPVGQTDDLLNSLQRRRVEEGALLIGIDFPIGLPIAYAQAAGFADYRDALAQLGSGSWSRWYDVCDQPDEVSLSRPFFPNRPGGCRMDQLLHGLGLSDRQQLMRRCDLATPDRRAGCPLFWTLGANQVGKAAIDGWQHLLVPNLHRIGLWPFDGSLEYLLSTHSVVLSEVYPAQAYAALGFPHKRWSKRDRDGRKSVASQLLGWIDYRQVHVSCDVAADISEGFRDEAWAEDRFDALCGLFTMLDVCMQHSLAAPPDLPLHILQHEGWILGQT